MTNLISFKDQNDVLFFGQTPHEIIGHYSRICTHFPPTLASANFSRGEKKDMQNKR